MLFSNDRQSHRRVFITAWEKAQTGQTLAPLEHQIVQVLRQHPEYQAFMRHGDAALERDFHPQQGETNPYLHLSLHLAIQDQLQLDQPAGIRGLYQELLKITGDAHETEHRIMRVSPRASGTSSRIDVHSMSQPISNACAGLVTSHPPSGMDHGMP